jgi:hypothetical protein
VRLESLYRVRFAYSDEWGADLAGPDSNECELFFLAEGRISGRFRGANHPNRRGDGTFVVDFLGVIETDDGAEVLFDYRGYGRTYQAGRRQIVTSATHLSEDERYRWLNDSLNVGVGLVRTPSEGESPELIIEWSELV